MCMRRTAHGIPRCLYLQLCVRFVRAGIGGVYGTEVYSSPSYGCTVGACDPATPRSNEKGGETCTCRKRMSCFLSSILRGDARPPSALIGLSSVASPGVRRHVPGRLRHVVRGVQEAPPRRAHERRPTHGGDGQRRRFIKVSRERVRPPGCRSASERSVACGSK